jgi:hypothetical protein
VVPQKGQVADCVTQDLLFRDVVRSRLAGILAASQIQVVDMQFSPVLNIEVFIMEANQVGKHDPA